MSVVRGPRQVDQLLGRVAVYPRALRWRLGSRRIQPDLCCRDVVDEGKRRTNGFRVPRPRLKGGHRLAVRTDCDRRLGTRGAEPRAGEMTVGVERPGLPLASWHHHLQHHPAVLEEDGVRQHGARQRRLEVRDDRVGAPEAQLQAGATGVQVDGARLVDGIWRAHDDGVPSGIYGKRGWLSANSAPAARPRRSRRPPRRAATAACRAPLTRPLHPTPGREPGVR